MKKYKIHNKDRQKIDKFLSPKEGIEEELVAFLPIKILTGLLTIIPWITSTIFLVKFFNNAGNPPDIIDLLASVFIYLINLAIIAYFLTFVLKSKRIPEEKRAKWVMFFFLNPLIAIIPLWYCYILHGDETTV